MRVVSWNIVKLDDKYYYLDATWDSERSNYEYFLRGMTDFENHIPNAEYRTQKFQQDYPIPEMRFMF